MARSREFDEDRAIDAAVDCFWHRGYEATSVRDLARHMGIGGASLYNAFGDKRALFGRALTRYADRSTRERIARLRSSHRPREAIHAFFAEVIDRAVKDRACKGCLLVNSALDVAPHDAELGRAVSGYLEEIRIFFRESIEAAHDEGDAPADIDAEAVATHLLGVLMGMRVISRTGAKRAALEAVVKPALDLLDDRQRRGARRNQR